MHFLFLDFFLAPLNISSMVSTESLHTHKVLNFGPDPWRTLDCLQLIFISRRFLVSSCLSLLSLASSCSLFVISNRAYDNRVELSWWYRALIRVLISGHTESGLVIPQLDPDRESLCFIIWLLKKCRSH